MAASTSNMSTPIKQSRLGPGLDTSATPLPVPGSAESKLWEPDWIDPSGDVWSRGKTLPSGSISEASPFTPSRSNSGFGAGVLRTESITIDEAKEKQPEKKKEDTSRRFAISASTPTQAEGPERQTKQIVQDISDSQTKSQKKRRGGKVEFKSPDAESPSSKKVDKRGVKQTAGGEEKGTDTESNSTTPRLPHRNQNKAPHTRLHMEAPQPKPQVLASQGGNPQQWAQHVAPPGVDAAVYAQYLAQSSAGLPSHQQNPSQNPTPHFHPATQAFSGYGIHAFGFSPPHPVSSSGGNPLGTMSATYPGYPEYLNSGSAGPQGGYMPQAGNIDSFFPVGNQAWAPTPMMAAASPYQSAGPMQQRQGQGAHHGYGASSNAPAQAGAGRLPHAPIVSSQALTRVTEDDGFGPFSDNTARTPMATEGVIKIGNIPYSSTKQDVWSALGKTAKVVVDCPIHIIMERSTAKTMDCFIEFLSVHDARAMIKKFDRMQEDGRPAKIGLRAVEYELSSQRELQKSLFPRAKCVDWTGGSPEILVCTDPWSTGFQGFVTREEMHQLVRHAEVPARAPYSSKCPQRPYECMISTLFKFPWHATDYYTNGDRFLMFKSTYTMIKALCSQLKKPERMDNLDENLLRELLVAAMKATGISEREKVIFAKAVYQEGIHVNLPQDMHEIYRLSSYANDWPFEVLGRKSEGVTDQICEYYFNILASTYHLKNGGTAQLAPLPRLQCYVDHEDEAQNARTMTQEIELEIKMLRDLLTEYAATSGDGHQLVLQELQQEGDKRFNDGLQELKRQNDMLAASMGPIRAQTELLAQRAQAGGFPMSETTYMPAIPAMQYVPSYSSPMLPPAGLLPGYQGPPQPFHSPFQQQTFPVGQHGLGYPPSSQGGGQPQHRLYDPYAQDPSETVFRSGR